MDFNDTLLGVLVGLGAAVLIVFVLRVPTNEVAEDDEDDEPDADDTVAYDPAAPDPWEAELGPVAEPRDIETLIGVLRAGEPGPCRTAIAELAARGEEALPALRAAAGEGDPDLRIDAEQAIALIEGDA